MKLSNFKKLKDALLKVYNSNLSKIKLYEKNKTIISLNKLEFKLIIPFVSSISSNLVILIALMLLATSGILNGVLPELVLALFVSTSVAIGVITDKKIERKYKGSIILS